MDTTLVLVQLIYESTETNNLRFSKTIKKTFFQVCFIDVAPVPLFLTMVFTRRDDTRSTSEICPKLTIETPESDKMFECLCYIFEETLQIVQIPSLLIYDFPARIYMFRISDKTAL